MSTSDDLRRIALEQFSRVGYIGTSLQQIAEIAGVSKSSVLYHYASKEHLLEVSLRPAVVYLHRVLDRLTEERMTADSLDAFVREFVDFLLEYRLEVNVFITQARAVQDVPIIDEASGVIQRIADYCAGSELGVERSLRFGIALGGAAYSLSAADVFDVIPPEHAHPVDETKAALVVILSELLTPLIRD